MIGLGLILFNNLSTTSIDSCSRCGRCTLIRSRALLDTPVKDIIVLEALADEEITEELAQIRIVGLVVEAESTGVVEENAKLVGEATTEKVGLSSHLLLHDTVVFLLLGRSPQTLPWELTTKEVEKDISQRLKIITSCLLNTKMGIDTSVTSGTSEVLVLSIGDVEMRLRVTVFLREAEIDDVYLITALSNTHQEVVRFDVTMDKVARVDILDPRDELISEEQNGLEGELAVAEVEEIFETGAKQVEDHGIVITLGSKPPNEGHTDATGESFVDLGFVLELGVFGLDGFELDGNFFAGDDIDAEVDVAEAPRADFLPKPILSSDTKVHFARI
jgi:hypothetical protein